MIRFDLFAAPSDAPTRLQSTLINSTSLLFSWHAPIVEHITRYQIQILDSNSTGSHDQINYTTENTHLLLSNLQPNHRYTFRVAAYANGRGLFSQLTATTLGERSPKGTILSLVLQEDSYMCILIMRLYYIVWIACIIQCDL